MNASNQNILISVVAPCLNEEGSLPVFTERVVKALRQRGVIFELLIVNDGSTDRTADVLAELEEKFAEVRAVHLETNQGIPAAWKNGVSASHGEFACLIDSDLQNPPEDIWRLYEAMISSRCDFAQAYRSEIERQDYIRFIVSRVFNWMLNLAFRDNAKDNKSGFLIGPRTALLESLKDVSHFSHFQSLIRVAARSKGYTFTEVESLFFERVHGESFLKGAKTYRVIFQSLIDLFRGLIVFGRIPRVSNDGNVLPAWALGKDRPHPYRGLRRLLFELYFATMPLHTWLITRNARRLYLQLKESEWLNAQAIELYQVEKLNRLINHAASKVPHYRRVLKDVLAGPGLRSTSDLTNLPYLEKDFIKENLYFDLFADNHDKRVMHKITTSGSTGTPLTIYADRFQLEVRFASTLRALEWTGWQFGDKQARLWHQKIGMSFSQVIKERLDALLLRRMFIPAFEISSGSIQGMISKIEKYRPKLIDGYAESLNFLAGYLKDRGGLKFQPVALMSSAQSLPDDSRKTIEEALGARVFDKYGSREFSGIAYQCAESRDYHVVSESYIVELLVGGRAALPGEIGEVVVTDLNNYSVPLIRYRIGDLALAVDNSSPCPCGREQPRIGQIQGRTQAIVYCADGLWIPGTFFAHFFKDHSAVVSMFQIHQEAKGEFTLRVVKTPGWTASGMEAVIDELSEVIGTNTKVRTLYVDEIPLLATGKRSPVVSEVREDVQALLGLSD
jgi:phenylacetate-CoA ligase